ncbi:T3SS (YopN, CesT) and YbjN peptide-binding chaperone 1 [Rhodococcus aerolatus]
MGEERTTWLRSHVRLLLQEHWGSTRVEVDGDGDIPFRCGSAACWVSVHDADGAPFVRVWAQAALEVACTKALLVELNDINVRSAFVTVSWHHGAVFVEHALAGPAVVADALGAACDRVGQVADEIGPLLAAMFTGRTPYPPETAPLPGWSCGPEDDAC